MWHLNRLVLAAAVLTIGVESGKKYFAGEEMQLSCPEFPEMDFQEVAYKITINYLGVRPSVEIRGYRNGSIISAGNEIASILDEARISFHPPVLRLKHLNVEDTGNYQCSTKFGGNHDMITEFIDVNATPSKIYTAEIATTGTENGNYAAHICVATGAKPRATLKWVETDTNNTCDFVETSEYDDIDLTFITKAVLRLPPGRIELSAEPARERSYTCVVTHLGFRVPRKKTANVKLMYIPGPVTISRYPNQPKQYDDVSLKCKSTCVPKCTFKWFLNGKFLSSGSKLYLTNITETEAVNSTYGCTAENKIGSASRDVRIHFSQDSKSQKADAAESRLKSIVLYIVLVVVGLIALAVLIGLLVKKPCRKQKIAYAINGSKSTESRADSNDDVYGFASDRLSQPSVRPDQSNAHSTAEETLSRSTNPPTPERDESPPPEQNIEDYIVNVPTLSDSFHHTFRDVLSPAYGHATVDRRFSSLSSRNRPLPLCEPTRFSTLPRNSTRHPYSRPCNISRDYYSRPESANPSRRYMLPPSIPENGPLQMSEAHPWMPEAVGSSLSVRPSHHDDAIMDGSLIVGTEV